MIFINFPVINLSLSEFFSLPVKRVNQQRIPRIRSAGEPIFNPNVPNIVQSNYKLSKRVGRQPCPGGGPRGRHLKPVFTREVDTMHTDVKFCIDRNVWTFKEKVLQVVNDDMHTGHLIKVAGDYPKTHMRWRIAPHTVSVWDILTTHLSFNEVENPKQGDTYRLAALSLESES